MSQLPAIVFSKAGLPSKGTVVVFCDKDNNFGDSAKPLDKDGLLKRAIKAADFKGGFLKTLDILVPAETNLDRILLVGLGKLDELKEHSWPRLGGKVLGTLAPGTSATIMLELPKDKDAEQLVSGEQAADFALGAKLGAYRFTRHKTKKDDKKRKPVKLTIHTQDAAAAKKAWADGDGVSDGVILARDLVNEPANFLTPAEFAKRTKELEKLDVKVTVLNEAAMKKLKMGALLGVAQGSRNPPKMAIMEWKGGKAKGKPVAFVGKGVTFDTGGISIKPSAGMEDMKGDMGGAAAVTGLMHVFAARKAKANVVGIIALVENMPDGNAQRPGDIVTAMSGKTIEVLNTDAEGRLVLADALWHCQKKYKPKFVINLATLTGAILVALGHHRAGLFSNDDDLAKQLYKAGEATRERLWRMPLGSEYDKLIDSKNADVKNIGGRMAGSVTAAQFLQRFIEDGTPWAHLDIAGTAMGSPQNEINKSWSSGYGVRLLDRLVADYYEG